MRTTSANELARQAGGEVQGNGGVVVGPDVVIDARLATPGSTFVAIGGERVDGHDFTAQAAANGAAAAIVTRVTDAPLVHVVVEDSVAALSHLARRVVAKEQSRGLTAIAVTGSSGKTSTKDLMAQVFEDDDATVSPEGSFNNEIGVPLTACRVDADTRYLVSEMGARGKGHIAWLCSIVRPDVALVLNVGTAHLGEFGSREGIAEAKGEIVEALTPDGWAVLNADDDLVAGMAPRTQGHLAWWSRTGFEGGRPDGDLFVSARDITSDALQRFSFTLVVERDGSTEEHHVAMRLLGSHQVSNALAAAAAAVTAGLEPAEVAISLSEATTRSRWRMELVERSDGAAILNDSYNANPDSMREALSTIGHIGAARRAQCPSARVYAVLGDMLELGSDSDRLHRELGERAVAEGVDEVIAVGPSARHIVKGATAAGGTARTVERDEVARQLALNGGDVVLVKASRGIGLDVVADGLARAVPTHGDEKDGDAK